MKRYFDYVIVNTNKNKFAVIHTEGNVRTLTARMVYDTYEEAYAVAKAYLFGQEPTDKTKHH